MIAAIDTASRTIKGISVMTIGEAIGHGMQVDHTTLEQVLACATAYPDGVKVKIDHGTGFDAVVGVLRGFRLDGEQLKADLNLLASHEATARILEIAETIPGSVGLSASFINAPEEIGGVLFARCSHLLSVDLVDSPAANPSGMFKSNTNKNTMSEVNTGMGEALKSFFGFATTTNAQLQARITQLEGEVKTAEEEATKSAMSLEEQIKSKDEEINSLKAQLKAFEDGTAPAVVEKVKQEEAKMRANFATEVSAATAKAIAAAGFSVPANFTAPSSGDQSDFGSKVKANVAKGMKTTEAIALATRENPAAHIAWLQSGGRKAW